MNFIRLESKVYNALYLLIFFFPLFIPITGYSITISAEGVEPLRGRPVATIRNIALSNAFKIAIETATKEMGSNLDDKSLEKLRSEDPTKYIKAYRILDEHSLREEYKISIEADIDSEKLRNRLEDFAGTLSKTSGKPSISIVVLQNPESDQIIKNLFLSDIKREISVALIGSGYRVVEPLGDVRLETYVTLKATESKIGQVMYYTFGSVLIRAKDKNGKVITEVSDSLFSNGVNLSQLSLEVLTEAGAKAANKLKSEFDKRWNVTVEEATMSN
jgi:hypothetical protein